MSAQQKYQIVSAGKVLRARNPAEVLAQMSSAFSISAQQARKLFVKGWVIKDGLSSGQVVHYRTQLHQIGLKIEVHPAGKFDNRAILARMQFARKRKARQATEVTAEPSAERPQAAPSEKAEPAPSSTHTTRSGLPNKHVQDTAGGGGEASSARAQLEALFSPDAAHRPVSTARNLGLLVPLVSAALVPALFCGALLLLLAGFASALWSIGAAILAGTFGPGVVLGALLKLILVTLIGALLVYPYFSNTFSVSPGEGNGLRLRKQEAPGLFLLLEVLEAKTGLSIAGAVAGPKTLAPGRQAFGTPVQLTPGAEVTVITSATGQRTLSLGLGAIACLQGGDLLALVARAMSYHQGPLVRAAVYCSIGSGQKLQSLQDALEGQNTLLNTAGEPAAPLKPVHKLLAACGLAAVPLIERVQSLHRVASGALARRLEARADAVAAQITGSDAFASFAERWNQLVHADLVSGEINREAMLTGRRLLDVPHAVQWLFRSLDEDTRNSIEMAMGEDTDYWSLNEPAGHTRIAAVEEWQISSVLQRSDFSLQKLFVAFDALCVQSSRLGMDERCRAVENSQLLTASKEVEAAQQVLSEYFNRAIPADFLPLHGPSIAELSEMALQETIDWLRSRLIDLQELEQRLAQLQLRGARIQLGAALVRANVRVDPRSYDLCGSTPSAAEESRKDNRARIEECRQQRTQIHSLFFQRIQRAMAAMPAADRSVVGEALQQLKQFETLREPLASLSSSGDLLGELIEQIPTTEFPEALVQKYTQLAVQQIRQVHQRLAEQSGLVPQALLDKLEAYGAGETGIPVSQRGNDLAGAVQGMELRCKSAAAVVVEAYHTVLANVLGLCLKEEGRQKVKPLRLVGAL
ncbi:hypothetical protein JF535_11000 [Microbulbifer salipaludis]|uniref:Uncharacterized protein n=1 Tax=Microbulbifer salipaludis TaxID=187980 RepID=A0ABS3E7U3_9GAMM|nr:hypothetical protein [Microbulbifer salipaludis]MBN8431378.1 hypothetical protein [Microbulbifer salipaludis]